MARLDILQNIHNRLSKLVKPAEDLTGKDFYVYGPEEDSELLLGCAVDAINLLNLGKNAKTEKRQKTKKPGKRAGKKKDKLRVLELGAGSGFVAFSLLEIFDNLEYTCTDINEDAVRFVSELYKKNKTKFNSKLRIIKSDLFDKMTTKHKFDLILFNPPYLPKERNEPEKMSVALSGGFSGYETTERFLHYAKEFLEESGRILFITTSINDNHKKLEDIMIRELFDYLSIAEKAMDFEKLFCYQAKKSDFAKRFKGIYFFKEGCHSYVYRYKNLIIKKLKLNDARYAREKAILEKLNAFHIGPKVFDSIDGAVLDDHYLVCEFVPGDLLSDYTKDISLDKIKKVNSLLLEQVIRLDQLGYKKEELHRITSNAIISKDLKKITLIDFERSHYCLTNDNFPQYLEYIKHLLGSLGFVFDLPKTTFANLKKYKKLKREYKSLYAVAKQVVDTVFFYADVYAYVLANQDRKKLITYNEIAKKLKISPRTVGFILKQNRNPHFVKCYRVIGANGDINGYMGEQSEAKKELLRKDGYFIYGDKLRNQSR